MAEGNPGMSETPGDAADQGARKRITPIDVQQKVFRRAALRGYHEQDVDDFLDEITEELALLIDEVRQLRERSGLTPAMTGDTSEALRTADDIVRQAREEAAEIIRRARGDAPASGIEGGSSLQPFLAQERTFLADLSKLVQEHTEALREMARARLSSPTLPPDAAAAPPAEAAGGGDTIEVGEAEPSEPAEDRV
jgi:DivIVA domain-containing protein